MTDATEKHLSVARQDVWAIIEDIRLGCPETAVKHLTAMLAAAPIANPDLVTVPRSNWLADVSYILANNAAEGDDKARALLDEINALNADAAPTEPVAWQYRLIGPDGPTKWRECNDDVREMISTTGHWVSVGKVDGVNKVPAELRPLYATDGNIRQRVNDGYFRRAISEVLSPA